MTTYKIDEELVQELANTLKEYIEEIIRKHPKKAIKICQIGSKLVTLPISKGELKMKTIKVFNTQEKPDVSLLKYDAGWVYQNGDEFFITDEQAGAEDTFSIGQSVFDKKGNLLGYLGISLLKSLDYNESRVRIPVETWRICLPTSHCKHGVEIVTYWQKELKNEDLSDK